MKFSRISAILIARSREKQTRKLLMAKKEKNKTKQRRGLIRIRLLYARLKGLLLSDQSRIHYY